MKFRFFRTVLAVYSIVAFLVSMFALLNMVDTIAELGWFGGMAKNWDGEMVYMNRFLEGHDSGIYGWMSVAIASFVTGILFLLPLLAFNKHVKKGDLKNKHFAPFLIIYVLVFLPGVLTLFLRLSPVFIALIVVALFPVIVCILAIISFKKANALAAQIDEGEPMPMQEAPMGIEEAMASSQVASETYKSSNIEMNRGQANRTTKPVFIAVTVMYAALLILGVLGLFGIGVLWDYKALDIVSGGWLIAFTASYGLYLFLLSPFAFSDKVKKIGVLCSILGLVLLDILPIVLFFNHSAELSAGKSGMFKLFGDNILFIAMMLVSEIGIVATVLLSQKRLDPSKVSNKAKAEEPASTSFGAQIAHILFLIVVGLFNSAMSLMRLKEKNVNIYVLVIVPLFSFLVAVLSEIMIILFVVFLIGLIFLLMSKLYTPSDLYVAEIETSDGRRVKLTQYSYQGDMWDGDDGKRYKRVSNDEFVEAE
ncbi:MAG: hypothetical protein J6328_05890 [Bacilli bacterium]|nr:hypothetical protein [Bacilli bacterium]